MNTATVIDSLEKCLHGMCNQCPYNDGIRCHELLEDAIEILKGKEPRVMAWKEVQSAECPMWIEEKGGAVSAVLGAPDSTPPSIKRVGWVTFDGTLFWTHQYGKTWRCWTEKPDAEQRKNTPWDERSAGE